MPESADIVRGLAGVMDRGRILSEPGEVAEYAVDGLEPAAVAFPSRIEETAEVMRYAYAEGLAVVPWGGGTKMGMGLPPARLDMVISTAGMCRVKELDSANLTITAEAGTGFRHVQAVPASEEGRCYLPLSPEDPGREEPACSGRSRGGSFLPLDPPFGKRATLGGVTAAGTAGPRRLLYGLPRDLVLGVRFVSPEGGIISAGGKTVKNVSGYDVCKLMIGSMGTLGLICELSYRLLPLPEVMETVLVRFKDLQGAMDLAGGILKSKLIPAAVEVMNGEALQRTGSSTLEADKADFVTAVALESFREAAERMEKEILRMAGLLGSTGTGLAREEEHGRFWLEVSELGARRDERSLVSVRLNYPLSRWKKLTALAADTLKPLPHLMLSHAGSGVLLLYIHPRELGEASAVIGALLEAAAEAGGNLTVLDTPAAWKKDLPVWGRPGQDAQVMRHLKAKLDPAGIMSPGRYAGGI